MLCVLRASAVNRMIADGEIRTPTVEDLDLAPPAKLGYTRAQQDRMPTAGFEPALSGI